MMDLSGADFQSLIDYIESDIGFPTSHYNTDYLNRRIRSRMRRSGTETIAEYRQELENCPQEQSELLDSFSINVTEFFRNPPVWDNLQSVLKALHDSKDGQINIWSAACADGREPYSIALIALVDDEIDASRINILATDINETALEIADRATYEKTQTENIPLQLEYLDGLSQYITENEGVFLLKPPVRDLVTFEKHDLIHGEEKSGFDMVLCRNLLIYIDNTYEPILIESIQNALSTGGFLIIGKSETIPPRLLSGFHSVNNRQRIYQTKH